jgi:hypothetical protein
MIKELRSIVDKSLPSKEWGYRVKHDLDIKSEALINKVLFQEWMWYRGACQQEQLGSKGHPGHPDNLGEPADGMVKTIYFCNIATSVLQPMDQNVLTFTVYLENTDSENKFTYGIFLKFSCQEWQLTLLLSPSIKSVPCVWILHRGSYGQYTQIPIGNIHTNAEKDC